ncbi:unnamed protein product [Ranitomeya imitator]|uniref:3-dehydroquinate synthase C-terminal domain-containing protein n=1 Tax=Ranitomeya imitator TaxID=111125 RepID=A0ABN9KQI7_9NEOB|nr:unnamed protein product [Ranitomeya imitator]
MPAGELYTVTTVRGATKTETPGGRSKQKEYLLIQVKNTWNCVESRQEIPTTWKEDQVIVSQAKMWETVTESGVSWTVKTPISFCYKVTETQNLLDPNNMTLLYGHVSDPQEVEVYQKKIQKRFVVMDTNVEKIYGSKVRKSWLSRQQKKNKSMELVLTILEEIHKFGIDRRTEPVIAIGGVEPHTSEFRQPFCLMWMQVWVQKNGVNFCNCKNKLGSYTPPAATFLDRSFIRTIPRRQISNGLGEILKMALMKHKGLFELLESHGKYLLDTKFQSRNGLASHGDAALTATRLAIQTMLEELAPNLWEDDLERLVDYGHVISPELEMKVLPALMHGEAVNIDMAFMTYVSSESGLLTAEEKTRTVECMRTLELPVWHKDCTLHLIKTALGERLKHSGGKLRLPLPTGLGTAEIFNDVDEETMKRAFEKWTEDCQTLST